MATSNPLDILLAHDRWATRQILDVCGPLTEEQFHKRFEMGQGSLHDTLAHMFAAMQAWTQILAHQEPKPRIDQDRKKRTVAELTDIHESSASELAGEVRRLPLDQ